MRLFPSSGGNDFGVGAVKEALWKSGTCGSKIATCGMSHVTTEFCLFCSDVSMMPGRFFFLWLSNVKCQSFFLIARSMNQNVGKWCRCAPT